MSGCEGGGKGYYFESGKLGEIKREFWGIVVFSDKGW